MIVRREISSAVKRLAVGRKKRGQRPAALPADGTDRHLIAAVNVGPLVAVHLHRHEALIDDLRDLRTVVRLAVHHMAPVAPHRANVQQDRLVLALRHGKGFLAPLLPLDGLMHGRTQVGGRRLGKGVEVLGGHGQTSLYGTTRRIERLSLPLVGLHDLQPFDPGEMLLIESGYAATVLQSSCSHNQVVSADHPTRRLKLRPNTRVFVSSSMRVSEHGCYTENGFQVFLTFTFVALVRPHHAVPELRYRYRGEGKFLAGKRCQPCLQRKRAPFPANNDVGVEQGHHFSAGVLSRFLAVCKSRRQARASPAGRLIFASTLASSRPVHLLGTEGRQAGKWNTILQQHKASVLIADPIEAIGKIPCRLCDTDGSVFHRIILSDSTGQTESRRQLSRPALPASNRLAIAPSVAKY